MRVVRFTIILLMRRTFFAAAGGEDAMAAGARAAYLELGQQATEHFLLNLEQNLTQPPDRKELPKRRPRVILISYPNSGTSFTMHNVRCNTRADVCTEYIDEANNYVQKLGSTLTPCGTGAYRLTGTAMPGTQHRIVKSHGVGYSAKPEDDKPLLEVMAHPALCVEFYNHFSSSITAYDHELIV